MLAGRMKESPNKRVHGAHELVLWTNCEHGLCDNEPISKRCSSFKFFRAIFPLELLLVIWLSKAEAMGTRLRDKCFNL